MLAVCLLASPGTSSLMAYPPAPYHTIYGTVRDEFGNPLVVTNAEVRLETLTGVQLTTMVVPRLTSDANYRMQIPMDAGLMLMPTSRLRFGRRWPSGLRSESVRPLIIRLKWRRTTPIWVNQPKARAWI